MLKDTVQLAQQATTAQSVPEFVEAAFSKDAILSNHQDILWLAGQVFLSRKFVQEFEEKGAEAIAAVCPYGDLEESELATFEACLKHPKLRALIQEWWETYDKARADGEIPGVKFYWAP